MAMLPIPGVNEANLVAKVSTDVIRGIRQANQPPPWPNTQSALLELLAILDEWHRRAMITALYADHLSRMSRASEAGPSSEGSTLYRRSNIRGAYVHEMARDSSNVLEGSIPLLWRLSRRRRRRAVRHGLRPILLAYCPNLLEQFEQATAARVNWVEEYGKGLDHWFDGSRTDEQITELAGQMNDTQLGLRDALTQLQKFITDNFPIGEIAIRRPI